MSEMLIQNPENPFTFINVFEIPEEEIENFIEQWNERSKFMAEAPGFLGAELNRAITPETRFQLINIAKFESYLAFEKAISNPEYRAELGRLQNNPVGQMVANRGFYRTAAISNPSK